MAFKWKTGDRFQLRYDFDYRADKVSYKAGEQGTITYASGPPVPIAFGVFDSTPHQYPLPLSFKAIRKISGRDARVLSSGKKKRKGNPHRKTLADRAAEASGRFHIVTRFAIYAQKGEGPRMHFDGKKFSTNGKPHGFKTADLAVKAAQKIADAHSDNILRGYRISVEPITERRPKKA